MITNNLIREATENDIPDIAKLYQKQLSSYIDKEVWEWQYFKREGYDTFFIVAEKDGAVVGTQAMIPIKMIGDNRIFLAGKSETTLIHTLYRGRGILEKMYSKLFEVAERRGAEVVWGFTRATKALSKSGFVVPTRLSVGYITLNVKDSFSFLFGKVKKYYGSMSYLTALPLFVFLFLRRFQLSFFLTYYRIKYRKHFKNIYEVKKGNKDFDALLTLMNEKNLKDGVITIYRDINYMNWRIFNNPRINYKVLMYSDDKNRGYIIFYISEGVLVLTDYYCLRVDDIFPLLLHNAINYALKNKCRSIQFFDNESPTNNKYRKHFKHYSSIRFRNTNPMVLKRIGEGFQDSEQDINKWFITEIFAQGI